MFKAVNALLRAGRLCEGLIITRLNKVTMKQRDIASFFGKKASSSSTPPAVAKAKPATAAQASKQEGTTTAATKRTVSVGRSRNCLVAECHVCDIRQTNTLQGSTQQAWVVTAVRRCTLSLQTAAAEEPRRLKRLKRSSEVASAADAGGAAADQQV